MFFKKKKKEKIVYNVEKMTKDTAGTRLDPGDLIVFSGGAKNKLYLEYAIIDKIENEKLFVKEFHINLDGDISIFNIFKYPEEVLKIGLFQIPEQLRHIYIKEMNDYK